MSEMIELSVVDSLTIADALVDVAVNASPGRVERIKSALHALGYPQTADAIDRMRDTRQAADAVVSAINAYSVKA